MDKSQEIRGKLSEINPQKDLEEGQESKDNYLTCPECGSFNIEVQSRCVTCKDCGFSLCSV